MSQSKPKSTYCTALTTFDEDGTIDEIAQRELFRRIGEKGVGLLVAGPCGEGAALSPAEMTRCLEIAVDEVGDRVPVRFMGVEVRTTEQMMNQIEVAEDCGADAVQIYSPDVGHGQQPGPTEIETYFRRVLESTRMRCVVSSHYYSGFVLDPMLMKSLVDDYEHLIGFSVTSDDVFYPGVVIDQLPDHIEVHVGGLMQALDGIAVGATGYLSTMGNIAPGMCQIIIDHLNAGAYREAFEAWAALMKIKGRLYSLGINPPGLLKAVLEELGHGGTTVRAPHLPVGGHQRQAIAKVVREYRNELE